MAHDAYSDVHPVEIDVNPNPTQDTKGRQTIEVYVNGVADEGDLNLVMTPLQAIKLATDLLARVTTYLGSGK